MQQINLEDLVVHQEFNEISNGVVKKAKQLKDLREQLTQNVTLRESKIGVAPISDALQVWPKKASKYAFELANHYLEQSLADSHAIQLFVKLLDWRGQSNSFFSVTNGVIGMTHKPTNITPLLQRLIDRTIEYKLHTKEFSGLSSQQLSDVFEEILYFIELSTKFNKRQTETSFYRNLLLWTSGFIDANYVVIGVHPNLKEQLLQIRAYIQLYDQFQEGLKQVQKMTEVSKQIEEKEIPKQKRVTRVIF